MPAAASRSLRASSSPRSIYCHSQSSKSSIRVDAIFGGTKERRQSAWIRPCCSSLGWCITCRVRFLYLRYEGLVRIFICVSGSSESSALKTGTDEIVRELWEEAYEEELLPSPLPSLTASPAGTPGPAATPRVSARLTTSGAATATAIARRLKVDAPGGTAHLLPDWTKPPMKQGAPSVYAAG